MKLRSFLFLLFFTTMFYSCEKDSQFEETGDGTMLKKVLAGDKIYSEYTYNDEDLILEEKSKYHYTKHNYNNYNQLKQSDYYLDSRIVSSSSHVLEEAMKREEWVNPENTEMNSYFSFEYDESGYLKKQIINRQNSEYISYSLFTYNVEGKVERRTSYHEDKVYLYDNYSFDSKGNLAKEERFLVLEDGTPELQSIIEYEFDNKQNPYFTFRGLMVPGRNTNRNNITKEISTSYSEVIDFIDQIRITEHSYEYNSKEYPVRRNDSYEYVYY